MCHTKIFVVKEMEIAELWEEVKRMSGVTKCSADDDLNELLIYW